MNPPVHAWATLFLHRAEQACGARPTASSSRSAFNKLLLNFTWWVNRKDRFGKNVFEGGFLGLDNIGVFDRSAPLPDRRLPGAGRRDRVDGALHAEHARARGGARRPSTPSIEDMVLEVRRALPLHRRGHEQARARGHVGRGGRLLLRPAAATRRQRDAAEGALHGRAAAAVRHDGDRAVAARAGSRSGRGRAATHASRCPNSCTSIHPTGEGHLGVADRGILALVNPERLRRILSKMLDENEFLSPYGIRSLSKFHEKHPYVFHAGRAGVPRGLPAGRIGHRHVRRQLQLARARSGCRSTRC